MARRSATDFSIAFSVAARARSASLSVRSAFSSSFGRDGPGVDLHAGVPGGQPGLLPLGRAPCGTAGRAARTWSRRTSSRLAVNASSWRQPGRRLVRVGPGAGGHQHPAGRGLGQLGRSGPGTRRPASSSAPPSRCAARSGSAADRVAPRPAASFSISTSKFARASCMGPHCVFDALRPPSRPPGWPRSWPSFTAAAWALGIGDRNWSRRASSRLTFARSALRHAGGRLVQVGSPGPGGDKPVPAGAGQPGPQGPRTGP